MITRAAASGVDFSRLDLDLRSIDGGIGQGPAPTGKSGGFADMLADGIKEVNSAVKESEKASMDLVSGKSSNIHETMLAVTKAELGFNMMVQMRNKAIEAYQEVMRMQV